MTGKKTHYDQYVTSGQAGVHVNLNTNQPVIGKSPYIERIIRLYFPRDRKLRIIDLGCGHGRWLYFLKRLGYSNLAGVDISSEQVELAHKLGVAEVQLGDLKSFIDKELQVDVVLLIDIIEHLTIDESERILSSISTKMNQGGKLILHVPNGEGLFGQRIRYGDLTHETCFTKKSMNQLLSPLGFIDIKCYEDKPIVHGLISGLRRIIWEVGTLYPRLLLAAETGEISCILSQNMTIVATKQ